MATTSGHVIVTGASGHIGFHVARLLLERGYRVTLLLRSVNENLVELEDAGATVHLCELADPATWAGTLDDVACLFHVAADNSTDQHRATAVMAGTFDLTRVVLGEAARRRVPTIVYTSSVVVLGRSDRLDRLIDENDRTASAESPYVKGKVAAEKWCDELIEKHGVDVRRVYPSWVIGPKDVKGTPPHRMISTFLRKPPAFAPGGGVSVTGVEAVAEGHVGAWLKGRKQGRYVLGGHNMTFRVLFDRLARLAGVRSPIAVLPRPIVVAGAVALSSLGKIVGRSLSPIDPAYARAVIGRFSWYDSSRAIAEIGYTLPDLETLLGAALGDARRRAAGVLQLGRRRLRGLPAAPGGEGPPLLITGAPGALGNHFIDAFVNGLGSRNVLLNLPSARRVRLLVEPRFVPLLHLPAQFEVIAGDLSDPRSLREAVAGIGTVFHLAGAVMPHRRRTFYEVNAEGTRHLVDACIEAGVERFLLMSTDAIAGHGTPEKRVFDEWTADAPYGDYGRSKQLAERYLLERTAEGPIKGTSLRGFWFFGPYAPARQRRFMAVAGRGRTPVIGGGRNLRSVSVTDNLVAAFLLAEQAPATIGKWYWVGDGSPDQTLEDIGRTLAAAAGSDYRPRRLPAAVSGFARFADATLARLGIVQPTLHSLGKYDLDIAGDIAAARRDFGYEPLASLADFARDYYAASRRNV